MAATLITLDTLDGLPLDMAREAKEALESGFESAIEWHRQTEEYNNQPTDYIYFPNAGRGGVCNGGNTDWTDCDGMDDLFDRWENYEDRWCN